MKHCLGMKRKLIISCPKDKDVKYAHAASCLPASAWCTDHTMMVWGVRWGQGGLQPTVPIVTARHRVVIPKESFIDLKMIG